MLNGFMQKLTPIIKKQKQMDLNQLKHTLDMEESERLSSFATLSISGLRKKSEPPFPKEYRQIFARDTDRILHSHAYTRYIDKTQVFYLIKNDHITHRVLHVQLVSKIARTIGRFLRLNEDLIEAIALGHDIGHTPFGHDGERFLSPLCQAQGIGEFRHSVQSVQFLEKVERKGKGWNLSLQTLDGILCHDGEIHNRVLKPCNDKSFEIHEKEIFLKKTRPEAKLVPMTLEGCVMRMADTISYIGRDLEDAIRLNIIKRNEIPCEVVDVLGNTNGTIVHILVTDIIEQSFGKDYISLSHKVSAALKILKDFNLEKIYLNPAIKKHINRIKKLFTMLFEKYLKDIEQKNRSSVIFSHFLKDMSEEYIDNHTSGEKVRDFIAGMTDQYFLRQSPDEVTKYMK